VDRGDAREVEEEQGVKSGSEAITYLTANPHSPALRIDYDKPTGHLGTTTQ
jgi:hypothetical protein